MCPLRLRLRLRLIPLVLLLVLPLVSAVKNDSFFLPRSVDVRLSNVTPSSDYIFNLGFPKVASSSFFEYIRCRCAGSSHLTPSHLVSHYLCGRKTIFASREFQTCGECIYRAAASHELHRSAVAQRQTSLSVHRPLVSLEDSCSGAHAYTQMDYANSSHCHFPQIENLVYLLEVFPEAKFVLLTRPASHWLKSVEHFFDLKVRLVACLKRRPSLFPKYDMLPPAVKNDYFSNHDSLLIDWYEWHIRRVIHMFRNKNLTNLLVLNIEGEFLSVQAKLDDFLWSGQPFLASGGTKAMEGGATNILTMNAVSSVATSRTCWGHSNKNKNTRA